MRRHSAIPPSMARHRARRAVVSTPLMTVADTDAGLLRAALGGDAGARRTLANRLLSSIHREVTVTLNRWSRGGPASPDKARDLTQDVLVTLFEKDARELRRWDPERGRSLDSFVRLVARRRCARVLERDLRRHGEPAVEPLPLGDDSLVERLRHRDALRDVLRGLYARMSGRDVELFDLLYVQDLDPDEVAMKLEMSRGAVNAWAYRMRKLARRQAEVSASSAVQEEGEARHV